MILLILIYLAAIVAANLTVAAFGPEWSIVNALLFIGLDLTARDRLHEYWHKNDLWQKMIALIAMGAIISYLLNVNAGQIAIASFLAFMMAGLADTFVYGQLFKRPAMLRMNGSNLVSAAVDSLAFPFFAFGLPMLWGIALGQFAAKVLGGFLWSLLLAPRAKRRTNGTYSIPVGDKGLREGQLVHIDSDGRAYPYLEPDQPGHYTPDMFKDDGVPGSFTAYVRKSRGSDQDG